jgi:hypothetical protein
MKPLTPGQTKSERLLGIFDLRIYQHKPADYVVRIEACFRYEVSILRQQMGGVIIVDHVETRDEWREVTPWGCFPKDSDKYKIT